MKTIPPSVYAKSFFAAASEPGAHADVLIQNFVALLQKRGDWSKHFEIVRAIETLERKRRGRTLVEIESARPITDRARRTLHGLFRGETCDFEERVHPELVAGVRITVDRERELDGTLTNILKKMFVRM